MKRISILLVLAVAGFPASAFPAEKPNPGVKEQAQLLLRENNSWWSYKTDPELRDW